jgi:peptide/nickel transport system substrate-binding protein
MRTWKDPVAFIRETGYRDPEVEELAAARASRRQFLRIAGLGAGSAGMAALLAACGGGGSEPSTGAQATIAAQPRQTQVTEGKRGGQVVMAQIARHDDIDPHVTITAVGYQLFANLCNTLIYVDNDYKFHPGLAESWTIEDDARQVTFKLRQGVKFHDGTPFTAQAMVFNFDRMVDPETKSRSARSLMGTYERSEAIDEHTVRVRFKEPYPAFLIRATRTYISPLSPTAIRAGGADGVNRRPVGTGPFKMARDWGGPGTELVLERNEDYRWAPPFFKNQGPPWLDRLIFREVLELTTRLSALESGELDLIHEPGEPNIERLNKDPKFLVVQAARNGSSQGVMINVEMAPTNELAVRQALLHFIDRDSMLRAAYFGVHPPAYGPMSPVMWGYDPAVEKMYPRDPRKAETLLEEAGWRKGPDGIRVKGGQRLKLINTFANQPTSYPPLHEFTQAQMKQLGVEIELKVVDSGALLQLAPRREGHLWPMGIRNNDPDVMRTIWHSENYRVRFIAGRDPKVDQLLEQGATAQFGSEERRRIYTEFQKYVMANAYCLPILAPRTTYAATAKLKNMPGIDSNGEYLWTFQDSFKE